MPRIHPRDIIKAKASSKALHALLPVTRDLASARHEFRWLEEHAIAVSQQSGQLEHRSLLSQFVSRRARGEPLQYVLGSEFFGDLEVKVRPGVLIPRQETAASISYLTKLITEKRQSLGLDPQKLRVLDLCTGTGCIPLLLHHEYYALEQAAEDHLEVVGVDISGHALSLARENLIHQIATQSRISPTSKGRTRSLHSIGFVQADVLKAPKTSETQADDGDDGPLPLLQALERLSPDDSKPMFNLLTANPPYISPKSFKRSTSRSVRDFEPLQALVPQSQGTQSSDIEIGDLFYPELLRVADEVEAEAFLFEVADMDQALRVVGRAAELGGWERLEVWRDEPGASSMTESLQIGNHQVRIRGLGHGRSVFGRRSGAYKWLAVG